VFSYGRGTPVACVPLALVLPGMPRADASPGPAFFAFIFRYACGSEAGSYLRLIDFVCHSTRGLRVIKREKRCLPMRLSPGPAFFAFIFRYACPCVYPLSAK